MRHLAFVMAFGILASGAVAQQPAVPDQDQHAQDVTWPCIQRKQPELSLGQLWNGPVPDQATADLAREPAVANLAERLSQRRLPVEDAEALVAEFAADGADDARLTALFQATFGRLNAERSALIAGIGRFGQKQVDLAAMIEDRRAKMAELESADEPDFDAIDAEEEALDWDERIFNERRQSLTYVCETPVIIEQRVFALGRAIAGHLAPQ